MQVCLEGEIPAIPVLNEEDPLRVQIKEVFEYFPQLPSDSLIGVRIVHVFALPDAPEEEYQSTSLKLLTSLLKKGRKERFVGEVGAQGEALRENEDTKEGNGGGGRVVLGEMGRGKRDRKMEVEWTAVDGMVKWKGERGSMVGWRLEGGFGFPGADGGFFSEARVASYDGGQDFGGGGGGGLVGDLVAMVLHWVKGLSKTKGKF
ncbi:hypothetical protein CsSME_00042357 [Camellia sinensis var. sinensis]